MKKTSAAVLRRALKYSEFGLERFFCRRQKILIAGCREVEKDERSSAAQGFVVFGIRARKVLLPKAKNPD